MRWVLMCLEQTINRSSKGKGGVIDERLAVNNLGRMLNGSDLNDEDDNRVNHKITKAEIDRQERNISNMIKFTIYTKYTKFTKFTKYTKSSSCFS